MSRVAQLERHVGSMGQNLHAELARHNTMLTARLIVLEQVLAAKPPVPCPLSVLEMFFV